MSNNKYINAHNLKSLNIENLFGINGTVPHTNGKLDINTLFKKNSKDSEYVFDSDTLLNGVRKRKAKVSETYLNFYRGCCEIITNASNAGITDITYEVPDNVIECVDYSPTECLKFIKEKLTEQHISTCVTSRRKIFITWHNLEEKLAKREEELQKIENINTLNNNLTLSSNENINEYYNKYTNN